MSEQSEFEKWFVDFYIKKGFITSKSEAYEIWKEARQQQAAELAALRGFAKIMESTKFERMLNGHAADNFIKKSLFLCKLIDQSGNPTPLLTGETE